MRGKSVQTTGTTSDSLRLNKGRLENAMQSADRNSSLVWLTFLSLILLVTISRLFFLGISYGSFPDSWRLVLAARHIAATGDYEPSRFPGYPLPEYFYALLVKLGVTSPFNFQLPAAILSGIAVGLFFLILMPIGYLKSVSLSLGLAFTPMFFVTSTETNDYVYGFTFFMAATLAALRGKLFFSGIALGLAAASRPTYALAFIPLALVILDFQINARSILSNIYKLIAFAATSGGLALLFYLQSFFKYGFSFLTFYERPPLSYILRSVLASIFGQMGKVVIAVFAIYAIYTFYTRRELLRTHKTMIYFAITVWVIYFILFLRLPAQTYYLFPAVAALFVLVGIGVPARWTPALPIILLASCFLVVKHDRSRVWLALGGPVLSDLRYQNTLLCIAKVVEIKARNIDSNTYIVADYLQPTLLVLLPDTLSSRIIYSDTEEDSTSAHRKFLTIDRVVPANQVPMLEVVDTLTPCPT